MEFTEDNLSEFKIQIHNINMKKKSGFELQDVCGEKVIIAQGIENIDFSKLIHLNETAAFLWEYVGTNEFNAEVLAEALIQADYDVDRETAIADSQILIDAWKEQGLIE